MFERGSRFPAGRWLGLWLLAAAGSALAQREAASPPASAVNFSFDQVEVRAFVKLIGEMTGRRFVVDDAVKGQITVITPSVPLAEVYPLFVAILESVGCSVVEDEGLTRVVALPPRALPAAPVIGAAQPVPRTGVVTKVIRLQNARVADLRRALESFAGREKGLTIALVEATNHLIVTDTAENVRRLEQVIRELDQPGLGTVVEVLPLRFLDAAEVSQQLAAVFQRKERPAAALGAAAATAAARELALVPVAQANSLIVSGTPEELAEVRRVLAQVDIESPLGRGTLHAVFLKYISAEEAAKSLNALLDKTGVKDPQKPASRTLALEANPANNALLVYASPHEFDRVRSLIDELDQQPQQVLIEVVIFEKTLGDAFDWGVELAAVDAPASVGDTVIQAGSRPREQTEGILNALQSGLFPSGLSVALAHGNMLDAAGKVVSSYPAAINMDAIRKDRRFKVLSSVPLLAQNNQEATVSVVNNIPLLKSVTSAGTGSARDTIQNLERVDVGIKLTMTPHINPDGNVRLTLKPSIEAIIDPGSAEQPFTPTIARREVSTTVTVPDNQTVAISGLIREDHTRQVRKVPLLGSIPLLGWLFQDRSDATERTNLIILVSPHVVPGRAAAAALTREWSGKTGLGLSNLVEVTTGTVTNGP
jgi:general secretion pathway protein D